MTRKKRSFFCLVQFLIELVSSNQLPEFTPPTPDEGTKFYVYTGASLKIQLYAKPVHMGQKSVLT